MPFVTGKSRIFPKPDISHNKLYHRTQLWYLLDVYTEILKQLSTTWLKTWPHKLPLSLGQWREKSVTASGRPKLISSRWKRLYFCSLCVSNLESKYWLFSINFCFHHIHSSLKPGAMFQKAFQYFLLVFLPFNFVQVPHLQGLWPIKNFTNLYQLWANVQYSNFIHHLLPLRCFHEGWERGKRSHMHTYWGHSEQTNFPGWQIVSCC